MQQYLVAKLAEVEARLELLDTMDDDASPEERERLAALSSRLVAALAFYKPAPEPSRNGAAGKD